MTINIRFDSCWKALEGCVAWDASWSKGRLQFAESQMRGLARQMSAEQAA